MCQEGKWLCVFLTYRCNATCHFCSAPFKDDRIYSDFGSTKEGILGYLAGNNFRGISFSGGDPFLVFERLMEWLAYFKKRLPDYYYWVYTNGLAADNRKIKKLAEAGMDEIRFNIAASGYVSENVWKSIEEARKYFRFVSVEVPSIAKDARLLKRAMKNLEFYGVDYLNLHDYILSESDTESHDEQSLRFTLNKNINLKYALSSRTNTVDILDHAKDKGYHFHINQCSMEKKEIQMNRRRLKMAGIFDDPDYDILLDDGIVVNYFLVPDKIVTGELNGSLKNPQFIKGLRHNPIRTKDIGEAMVPGNRIIKVFFIPRMNIFQGKIPLKAEVVNIGE